MYVAKDSIYKQAVREKLYSIVTSHIPKSSEGNILTLSNSVVSLESRILEHIKGTWGYLGSRIICYERDPQVFNILLSKVGKSARYCPIYGDIFDSKLRCDYSFVWLDFCNSYTDDFITRIIGLVEKIKFNEKSVLSITLSRRRGTAEQNLEYNKYFKDYKKLGFAQHILKFLPPVAKVNKIDYTCSDLCSRGTPMTVFNFLIDKTKTNGNLQRIRKS